LTDALPALREHTPLAPLTTMGVGGPARWFCEAATAAELAAAIRWAKRRPAPLLLLGGGSNLVPPDAGFPGLAIRVAIEGIDVIRQDRQHLWLRAMAGERWDALVAKAVGAGWAGIECLSGIPGSVGAAPIQNIGAYGQELAETCESVEVLDLETLAARAMPRAECGFRYRQSVFKNEAKGRFAVLSATLKLRKDGRPALRYPDLTRRLGPDADLSGTREAVLAVRRGKSMVVDPDDPNSRGCGSFFMNPILSPAEYEAFLTRNPGEHPSYPAEADGVKLAAAWLIEHAGFGKGFGQGRVGLSERHCLAIVNRGGATSAEVVALMRRLQEGVFARFGVQLHPEPEVLEALPA